MQKLEQLSDDHLSSVPRGECKRTCRHSNYMKHCGSIEGHGLDDLRMANKGQALFWQSVNLGP